MTASAPASEATIRGYGWEDHTNVTAVPSGADLNWFDAGEVNEYQAAMLGILGGAQTLSASITASTTQTQAGGQALTRALNEVSTVANANDTVVLPTAVAGNVVTVINNGANTLRIFPFSGDAIDGLSANTAITCAVGTTAVFRAKSASAWDSSGIDEFFDTVVVDQGLIVNEGGGDNDSRFEGSGNANLLYVDAGNNRIGINEASPAAQLEITSTSSTSQFQLTKGSQGFSFVVGVGGLASDTFGIGDGVGQRFVIKNGGNVGIGKSIPTALLHVDQAAVSGAKPVLLLDQADVSEEFVRFVGTAASGNITQSIVNEADVDVMTLHGFVKVNVQDVGNQITDQAYFMPIYLLSEELTSSSSSVSSTSTSTSSSSSSGV